MKNILIYTFLAFSLLIGAPSYSADLYGFIDESAFKRLKPLAEKGNATAQSYLGLAYYNGSGVTQDYKDAARWWKLAAEHGNACARKSLAMING